MIKFNKILVIITAVFAIFAPMVFADYSVNSVTIVAPQKATMGYDFQIKATVDSNSPDIKVHLDIPTGLTAKQSVDQDLRDGRVFTWDISGTESGVYAFSVSATDGTNYKYTSSRISVDYNYLKIGIYASKSIVKPGETFTVTGNVYDNTNAAISAAQVQATFGPNTYTTTTDSNGAYSITVSGTGSGTQSLSLTVTKNSLSNTVYQMITVSGSANTQTPTSDTTTKSLTVRVYDTNNNLISADSICVNNVCINDRFESTFSTSEKFATIIIKKSGYADYVTTIEPTNGMVNSVILGSIQSSATSGSVNLFIKDYNTGQYLNAKVTLSNGQTFTINGNTQIVVPNGIQTITVEADGHEKEVRTILPVPGSTILGAFSLKPTESKAVKTVSAQTKETASTIGIIILWIAAILSVIVVAGSVYWFQFRNPVEETEKFE